MQASPVEGEGERSRTGCGFADRTEARAAVHGCTGCGFTMVELIMVIVIVGILATFAVPLFFNVQVFQERGFFDEVVSAVRYAQKYAVASGCNTRVFTTAAAISLNGPDPANPATCTAALPATVLIDPNPSGDTTTFTRTAPAGVTLTVADFNFLPDGSSTVPYPSLTISVGGQTLTVFQQTGFVRVP